VYVTEFPEIATDPRVGAVANLDLDCLRRHLERAGGVVRGAGVIHAAQDEAPAPL